ncbi:hypothetical protein FOL47_005843 [Perkinsus chesapeaki]|uniref:Uncharacterized protein n=1 Tax=Perkinsus chesapeaki TaxID=330153 RepID=A0A7J6LV89_PERCH|nr:hypothetical protein FOL47_005843 [Perkinsus chesapeaki]
MLPTRRTLSVLILALGVLARRKSLSFGREAGEIERQSSSRNNYHADIREKQAESSTTKQPPVALAFDEDAGDVTTSTTTTTRPSKAARGIRLSFGSEDGIKEESSSQQEHQQRTETTTTTTATPTTQGISFEEDAGDVTTTTTTATSKKESDPPRSIWAVLLHAKGSTSILAYLESTTTSSTTRMPEATGGVNFEEEDGERESRSSSSEEIDKPVIVPDNSTTGVKAPACHSQPESIRIYNSQSGEPIPINTNDTSAPYRLDIVISTIYFGPPPSDLLVTAILKDGNIVEIRFKDRKAMRCFLVFIFEKKTVGEDEQEEGVPEEEGDEEIEEVPIDRSSNAVNPNFTEEEGIVEEKEDEEIHEATTGELPEEITTTTRMAPTPTTTRSTTKRTTTTTTTTSTTQSTVAGTTTVGLVFGENDGEVEPPGRSDASIDEDANHSLVTVEGSRLSFGMEEGEEDEHIEEHQESTERPAPTSTTATTSGSTTSTTTTASSSSSGSGVDFGEHSEEVTTTKAPPAPGNLAFGSEEGSSEEVSEGDAVKQEQEQRNTTTTTTTTATEALVTTTTRATTKGIVFGESDGEVQETTEGPSRVLFGEEDGETVEKEESDVDIEGESRTSGGQSDRLEGGSEVAEHGEKVERQDSAVSSSTTTSQTRPSSSTTTKGPGLTFDSIEGEKEAQDVQEEDSSEAVTSSTTAVPSTVGINFGEASGSITTSPPSKTGGGLSFGMEEGESEEVVESASNAAVNTTVSPSTTALPPSTTSAGILFGESDGEVDEPEVVENKPPFVQFGEEDGETEPKGEGVRLGGGTHVTEGGSSVEEGGHEIREHQSRNETESSQHEQQQPGTGFDEDIGEIKPHEPSVVTMDEEEGEADQQQQANSVVAREHKPALHFSEMDGKVEPEKDSPKAALHFGEDEGVIASSDDGLDTLLASYMNPFILPEMAVQQGVQLGGGTTSQNGADAMEEGGSYLNSTESNQTEASAAKFAGSGAGGWRVREVKLVGNGRDLTSKSKAQQLADLNIHGGVYTQKHAGYTEEGGFHINDTMSNDSNETMIVGEGQPTTGKTNITSGGGGSGGSRLGEVIGDPSGLECIIRRALLWKVAPIDWAFHVPVKLAFVGWRVKEVKLLSNGNDLTLADETERRERHLASALNETTSEAVAEGVRLAGGTDMKEGSGAMEEGGEESAANEETFNSTDSSSSVTAKGQGAGWRVKAVKVLENASELTVTSRARELANLNINGGTTMKNSGDRIEEGGSLMNSTEESSSSTSSSSSSAGAAPTAGGWRVKVVDKVPDARQLSYQRPGGNAPSNSTPTSLSSSDSGSKLPDSGIQTNPGMRRLYAALSRL